MKREVLVDTSGFYALLVKRDDRHQAASRFLHEASRNKQRFVTTDYILDETATLLKARGNGHLIDAFFESVCGSKSCRIEWTDVERFHATRALFLKHIGNTWSFTDCLSFRVMTELHLREALTKDAHFEEAGYSALLIH